MHATFGCGSIGWMALSGDLVEIVAAAPVEPARRALRDWALGLGLDVEELGDDLIVDERLGPDGKPIVSSYALRRAKAVEVFAAAGKPVPVTRGEFVERLAAVAPAATQLLTEHLADNGELLLHLFVVRVRDLAIEAFESGNAGLSGALLKVLDAGLRSGDAAVENAVAVSFVEDAPLWDPDRAAFIRSWPVGLREEADRQLGGRE